MRENILIVELVLAMMVPPTGTVRDVALSDGLVARVPSPFSRYGGVKICPSSWMHLPPTGFRSGLGL